MLHDRKLRSLVRLGLFALLLGGVAACKKDDDGKKADDDAAEEAPKKKKKDKEKPIVDKPIGELTKEDFSTFCKKLGWDEGSVSFSESGPHSNVIAGCVKEDPKGLDSPDGKKRAHLRIALYKTPQIDAERKAQDERAAAYVVEGSALFSVSLHDKDKAGAQAILGKLLGDKAK